MWRIFGVPADTVGADVVVDEVLEPVAVAGDRAPVGRHEPQRIVAFFDDAERTLVQQVMVIRAEQRQVAGNRLAALDPMLQVMTVAVAASVAAGEGAAAVTRVERTP
jgi:hypothetical protein